MISVLSRGNAIFCKSIKKSAEAPLLLAQILFIEFLAKMPD